MKYYYTYILKSKSSDNLYIGWTENLVRRISLHNLGRIESTKDKRPYILIYYEACLSKKKAIKREKQLKTGYGRKYIKSRI